MTPGDNSVCIDKILKCFYLPRILRPFTVLYGCFNFAPSWCFKCILHVNFVLYNHVHLDCAADTILDVDIPDGELDERQQELVEVSAEMLYGLIHARFILTGRGMHAMLSKYTDGAFGRCPRVHCGGQTVLPVGQSDLPRCSTVKIFCPMCWDLYFPRSRNHNTMDGSYWGTTFPHLFLHTYQNLVPQRNIERYVPRIYGFKIHKSAAQVRRNLGIADITASSSAINESSTQVRGNMGDRQAPEKDPDDGNAATGNTSRRPNAIGS